MKILIMILALYTATLFAQDTSIVKYLPLKTGNMWVYNYTGSSSSGKMKMTVSGTVINNGHIYYSLALSGNACGCSFNSFSPFLIQLNSGIRVDSLTGNIYTNSSGGCDWNPNEVLIDSLKMLPTMMVNNSCYTTSCQDTNNLTIFSGTYKTKYVGQNIMTYYKFRRYARYLGLTNSVMGCYAGTTCVYNLQGCIIDGVLFGDTSFLVGINQISTEIPENFSLSQNYPNPFNPVTKVKFEIPLSRGVGAEGGRGVLTQLSIYDALGKEITVLVNQQLQPGTYEADWDASAYPSGVYYYNLEVSPSTGSGRGFTETKKMVLIK
ncbi:MAG: hypothetical protein IAE93_03540 [Ignavibacteria bacterium]|mgnify:CR=1 FL=1|nr:hypothetical protein [Ignavibacteria bacterium]